MSERVRGLLRKLKGDEKGFTLIELLVVVAIIAILAAVLLPKLLGYTNKARVSRVLGDLAAMRSVIEVYAADEGEGYYPRADNSAGDGIAQVLQDKGIKWTGGPDGVRDPWGEPYGYGTAGTPDRTEYLIRSKGPDRQVGTNDDVWASSKSVPVQSATPDVTPTTTVPSAS